MTCCFCKGHTEDKLKTYVANLDKCVIIIKNVPSSVCIQCGEVFYSDDVVIKLEKIIDPLENIIKEVAIVDYSDSVA